MSETGRDGDAQRVGRPASLLACAALPRCLAGAGLEPTACVQVGAGKQHENNTDGIRLWNRSILVLYAKCFLACFEVKFGSVG